MASNLPKLSARAALALEVLGNGGYFKYALERNSYTGYEKFTWSLRGKNGVKCMGVGGAAYRELEKAGFAFKTEWPGILGSSTLYRLNAAA